ncbi:MAG: hypothetical protein JJ868_11790 [Shimia sp.]|uniref:hypothetical protein n=1 Tax=Shimia sp. TaxID=1954381 RepID=UPI001B2E2475|nr:hypothetical protein [Shimia sp.]MBO6898044.1 hypothetical protein [Shimia sp.]
MTQPSELTYLLNDLPLWCSIDHVVMAVNRAVPRTEGVVKIDMRHGLGQHVQRKRLGRHLYYNRAELIPYIEALLESMEPVEGLDERMVAMAQKATEAVQQRKAAT